ncbi:MAG: cation:proton antiporter [Longimicrobiales bacterium]
MDPLVGTLILIVLALLGARFSFSTRRVREGPRLLFRTGTHFLLLGLLVGPVGLGILTPEATRQLFPFLALGLGWVGFHFGLQLDWDSLRRFPVGYHVLAAGQAVLAFLIVLAGGWLFFRATGLSDEAPFHLVLLAAATASVSTPAGIAMVSSNFLVRGNVRDLLLFTASLDAGVGFLALAVTYSLYRPEAVDAGLAMTPQPALVAVTIGLGVVCGIVFAWLVRRRPAAEELMLYILGICAFAAGAALQWGLSPLMVSVTMGAVVANMVPDRMRIMTVLQRWEKPVYLTFLLIAGALLSLPTVWIVVMAVGYTLLRAVAKGVGAATMVTLVPVGFDVPRRLGLGLLPQGGVSLAMAVSGALLYSGVEVRGVDAESALFTVIVIGVLISEITGPTFTVQLLRRAGEISPRVEEALAKGDERGAEREAIRHSQAPDRMTPEDG